MSTKKSNTATEAELKNKTSNAGIQDNTKKKVKTQLTTYSFGQYGSVQASSLEEAERILKKQHPELFPHLDE